jgi:hypothetical protein
MYLLPNMQRCTNLCRQVATATTFCTVATNCVSLVRKLLHVILLAPGILRWLLDLWEICAALLIRIYGVDMDRDNFTFLFDKMMLEDGC